MSGPTTRSAWLPWSLVFVLLIVVAYLAYLRFQLMLMNNDFLQRDRAQQAELDHVQGQVVALQKENARLRHQPASFSSPVGENIDLTPRDGGR